ncbi:MAG: S41 family peptidase [Anaerolineales bacterium]|nr:S41 family peptidase [Anaerolineales bacterium]
MSKKILLIGGAAVIVLLLVLGSFSIGMLVGGGVTGGEATGGEVTDGETPQASTSSAVSTASTILQETVEDILQTSPPQATSTPADLEELFDPFWQSWELVHDLYIDQPVSNELMMQGAIKGMMDSLGDQHSSYMDPDQYRQANVPLEGGYEGIGAWVDGTRDYLTIVSPMPDSPAEKAGLQPGDQIIAIDGEDMTGIDGNLVIRKVLGPAGTSLTLTIYREGEEEPFDVTLERARIIVPVLEYEMLDGNIAYIKLYSFSETATEELAAALEDLMEQEPAGLILDLRNNPGGERDSAVEISSQFIGEGAIMYQEYGDGSRDTFEAVMGGLATDIPLVVLINDGSASASEIVAGAIQDYERGTLVGTVSFGKGSVQNWIPLVDEQGMVRVTIARWLTPNGRTIHELGVVPDIEIEFTEEDFLKEIDPQLDKAIELLTSP